MTDDTTAAVIQAMVGVLAAMAWLRFERWVIVYAQQTQKAPTRAEGEEAVRDCFDFVMRYIPGDNMFRGALEKLKAEAPQNITGFAGVTWN